MKNPDYNERVAKAITPEERQRLDNLPKRTVTVSGRMSEQDREALRRYFSDMGVSVSTGVTIALKEYMKRHGVK